MNQEIKEKWVAALRSGDYKQGKGMLHNSETNTYCCLGVLCHLAAEEGVVTAGSVDMPGRENVVGYGEADGYHDGYLLPWPVMDWAGISQTNPGFVGENGRQVVLSSRNDKGATFTEIADLIEQHL